MTPEIKKALDLALDALEAHADIGIKSDKAITAIKQARSAPVQPVAWVDLLKQAEEVVRSKSLWKKYIDGTPLANDIAVWMANFAEEHTTPQEAQPAPASWMEMVTANLVREGIGKHKSRELAEHFYGLAQPSLVQEPTDDELTQALIERDEAENTADELAQAIAQITGEDIGEHTSANSPWHSALDAADEFLASRPPAAQRPFVGLTDEDVKELCGQASNFGTSSWIRYIEAKLRSKNENNN